MRVRDVMSTNPLIIPEESNVEYAAGIFFDPEYGAGFQRGRCIESHGFAGKTSLAEEITRAEQTQNGFPTRLRKDGPFDFTVLDEIDPIRLVAFREDHLFLPGNTAPSCHP